jgi:glycosyltransferase involved in cell wall biosynthesis
LLFESSDLVGLSPSIHSPLFTWLFHRRRAYLVLHHFVGKETFRKLGARGLFPFLAEQFLMRMGRNYCTVNRALHDRLRVIAPKSNVHATTNGIDADLLHLTAQVAPPRFILYVGRFDVYMKGLDVLLQAYVRAHLSEDIALVIAGRAADHDLEEVRRLVPPSVKASVRLEPNISEARKRALLSACLFFCAPSRFEGFGIAALEASAAGKAVLVTDTDGFRDSQIADETCLRVRSGDAVALAAAMERLASDRPLCDALGYAGRRHASGFTWDAVAESDWRWIRTLL